MGKRKVSGFEVTCKALCVHSDKEGGCKLYLPGKPIEISVDGMCRKFKEVKHEF